MVAWTSEAILASISSHIYVKKHQIYFVATLENRWMLHYDAGLNHWKDRQANKILWPKDEKEILDVKQNWHYRCNTDRAGKALAHIRGRKD